MNPTGDTLDDVVVRLRAEQSQRWRAGDRVAAEEFIAGLDPESALVLIGGEIALRLEAGEVVDLEELVGRFPEHQSALPLLLEMQRELAQPDGDEVEVVVPGFEVEDVLGRGSFGIVYRARQLSVDRPVALKVLLTGGATANARLSRFRAEAVALGRLAHPGIVQIHDVGEARMPGAGPMPYLALEFVDGPTLAKWARGRAVRVDEGARIIEQVAGAIAAAHAAGIVHRDLKPANILLTAELMPKVADFGVAKLLDGGSAATATGSILGTPAYMAPEQASAGTTVGPASDVFALGAILYELLVGAAPFRGDTAIKVMHQVMTIDPVAPSRLRPGVPRDLETICLKCLEKEPARRYADARELAEELERFRLGLPVRARPLGTAGRVWRWCRRYPLTAGLGAAVALLVLTVAIVSTVSARQLGRSLRETRTAEREARLRLLDSLIAQADANRRSNDTGRRIDTIALLQQAAGLADELQAHDRDDAIRDLALTTLMLADMAPVKQLSGLLPDANLGHDFAPGKGHLVRAGPSGELTIINEAGGVVTRVPTVGAVNPLASPGGRYVAVQLGELHQEVWDVESVPPRKVCETPGWSGTFSQDASRFATADNSGIVRVFALPSGERLAELPSRGMTREVRVAMHPREPWISTTSYYSTRVMVRRWTDDTVLFDRSMPQSNFSSAWSPDGQWMAVAGGDGGIHVFDTATWQRSARTEGLEGGTKLRFDASSRAIIGINTWLATTGIWSRHGGPPRARAYLETIAAVQDDGRRTVLQVHRDVDAHRWAIEPGHECWPLISADLAATEQLVFASIHPGGRLLVVSSATGLRVFDCVTGDHLATLGAGRNFGQTQFLSNGDLIVCDQEGVWRLSVTVGQAGVRLGPRERLVAGPVHHFRASPDGATLAYSCRRVGRCQPYSGMWHGSSDGPARRMRSESLNGGDIAISADGQWILSVAHLTDQVLTSRVADGRPGPPPPPGKYTVTSCGSCVQSLADHRRVWSIAGEPPTWSPGVTLPPSSGLLEMPAEQGFIVDQAGDQALRVVDRATGQPLFQLQMARPVWVTQSSPDGARTVVLHRGGSASVIEWHELFRRCREAGLDRGRRPLPEMKPPAREVTPLRFVGSNYWPRWPRWHEWQAIARHMARGDEAGGRAAARAFDRLHLNTLHRLCLALTVTNRDDPELAWARALAAMERGRPATHDLEIAARHPQLHDAAEVLIQVTRERESGRADDSWTRERLRGRITAPVDFLTCEAFSYLDRGQYGPALACFEAALLRAPDDPVTLRFAAVAYLTAPRKFHDTKRGLALGRRARQADASKSVAIAAEALALVELERFGEAQPLLVRLTDSGERNFIGLGWLGQVVVAGRQNRPADARQAWAEYWRWAGAEVELPGQYVRRWYRQWRALAEAAEPAHESAR